MATERQSPDGLLVQTNLSGVLSAIQDDPDSPDANWLTYITNNVDTVCRVSFPTPTGNPTVGADLQQFKIWVRKQPGTGTPTVRIELYEDGVSKGIILANTNVTSSTGQLFSGTWNANLLGTVDGSLVECYIYGTAVGGAPAGRCTVEIGAVEWNVTYTAGATTYYQSLPATAIGVGVFAKASSFYRTLAPVAVGAPSLSCISSFYRTLSPSAVGIAVLNKGMYMTIDATAIGVALLSTAKMFSKALDTVALGVASLAKVATYQQIISATAVGVVNLTKVATHYLALATSATGVAQFIKGMSKTLLATAIGTPILNTTLTASRTLVAIATGQAVLTVVRILTRNLIAVAQGVAGLVTQFIAGGITGIKGWWCK